MNVAGRGGALSYFAAAGLPLATILIVVWPNLAGTTGTGPETVFDLTDPIFGDSMSTPPRGHDDATPVQVDWPRDRRLRERVREGHFDLWNPAVGNGVPLAPDPGGLFSPLRVLLYFAPFEPYTAFVLFRVARLFVAALGSYFLARAHGQSRTASGVVSIVFGLSGGMVSQLPFAEVSSVCWLPWICWAQLRAASRMVLASVVPLGLAVAATATGGHQPIAAGVLLGGGIHALGVLTIQRSARARVRSAALLALGYTIGLLLAAPALLPFVELLKNGHTYKSAVDQGFRTAFIRLNRLWFFPAVAFPQSLDRLRSVAGTSFPYILNFSCGVLAYLLVCIATARRRFRFEWALLMGCGAIICLGPPGSDWVGKVPLLKDILPRYMWSLLVLPIAVTTGFGVDALAQGRQLRVRSLVVGCASFMILLGAILLICRRYVPELTTVWFATLNATTLSRWTMVGPFLAALALASGAALLSRFCSPTGSGWLLLVAACIEVASIAIPHLREPPSRRVRETRFDQTEALAAHVEATHGRVGGSANLIVGWRGWREVNSITPLAPRRYARFIQASGGPYQWTGFALPGNRSAFADMAAVETVIVPLTESKRLEDDPQVTHVRDINAVSIFHNAGALPRARIVHATHPVATTDEAMALLMSWAGGAAHVAETPLAQSVILEPEDKAPGSARPKKLSGGASSSVEFILDEPDHTAVRSRATEAGYLVLADTHYPGWKATVDGVERPIFPANVGFRAVFVEAGNHRIDFRFRPQSVRVGLICAAIGALICVAIAGSNALRSRYLSSAMAAVAQWRSRLPPGGQRP